MKKIISILILLPNVAFAQGLSLHGDWGGPPEKQRVEKEYYPDNVLIPGIDVDDWVTDWLPSEPKERPHSLPEKPYADPTPDNAETTPFLKITPKQPKAKKYVDPRPNIEPIEPEIIDFPNNEAEGTILIDSKHRALYFVLTNNEAYYYPIGVGRDGFRWSGVEKVSRIQYWPDWNPPKEMLARRRDIPEHMEGSIYNPLGAVAIYLGNSLYRIHGTNDPKSIGKAESSGCFRMMNEHAVHLASIVEIGATVKVYQ